MRTTLEKNALALKSDKLTTYIMLDGENPNLNFETLFVIIV